MSKVVVDTDVVSFLFKRDSRALLYEPHLVSKSLLISFMTVAELDQWALGRNWGEARKRELEQHIRKFLIIPVDRALCLKWALVNVTANSKGRPIACADAWIAATALLYEVPLVTHNRKHYEAIDGLILISES